MPVIGPGTGASPWTPAEIPSSSFFGWWDASDTSTVAVSGAVVSRWMDKSGNGRDWTPFGTGPSVNRQLNGRPCLNFILGSTGMQGVVKTLANANPHFLLSAVVEADTWQSSVALIGSSTSATFEYRLARDGQNDRDLMSSRTAHYDNNANKAFTLNVPYITTVQRDVFKPRIDFFLNGAVDGTANTSSFAWTATNATYGLTLNDGSVNTFDGGIGELIILMGPAALVRREQIEHYLSAKWRIPLDTRGAASPALVFQ